MSSSQTASTPTHPLSVPRAVSVLPMPSKASSAAAGGTGVLDEVRRASASGPNQAEPKPNGAELRLLSEEERFLRLNLTELTEREREVVMAICTGGTNEAIADRLCIALPTLRTHLMRLNQKLGTTSKGDVVRHAAGILIEGYRHGAILPAAAG